MELKLSLSWHTNTMSELLIVPYGIETSIVSILWLNVRYLLIVPYGIETVLTPYFSAPNVYLLIVPYGIETAELARMVYESVGF